MFAVRTPLGAVSVGDAGLGICGGMVFTTLDLFHHGRPVPAAHDPPGVFGHLARRLIASWNLPLGGVKYYDWQRRRLASRFLGGVRVSMGLTARTVEREWPRIRKELDAGRPAPLGLIYAEGWSLRKLGRNHQVLAYGYDLDDATQDLTVFLYDPNFPGDDDCTLTMNLNNPDAGTPIRHSREGPTVRAFFLTPYSPPADPPGFTALS